MLQSLHRILVALAVAIALPAAAQSDPPGRVGRLAHFENQVFFRVDRSDQGGPATVNWPVSSGAILETGEPGRAEVWIGSTAYRLGEDSQLEFTAVDDARVDVRLNGGSLAISILDREQAADVMVATPDGNVRFLTAGRYRINILADRSELSVQAGRAVFDDGRRATSVAAGQKLSRWSDGGERVDGDLNYDAFDQWVARRENVTLAGASRRHVSPYMTGYQDLDAYGDWRTAPDYGAVWYPRVVADDWAPYRYGRWAWVAPWGWTWIDQSPWGFAPFHYGRWAIIHGRWGWLPGRLAARPVYAPALVGWIGNPGWNVGFNFGVAPAVGWFPLAPREVYVPGHRHSPDYVRQINIGHVRDVSLIDRAGRPGLPSSFAYHGLPRAVTVVPADLVRAGRPIMAGDILHHERQELGRAPLARHAPSADWLSPAPDAMRVRDEAGRHPLNRRLRPGDDAVRQDGPERVPPRAGLPQRAPERPAFGRDLPAAGNERDVWRRLPEPRPGAENRGRPVDLAPAPAPLRREAPEFRQPMSENGRIAPSGERRDAFRQPREMPAAVGGANPPGEPVAAPMSRREIGPRPVESLPAGQMTVRPPEIAPARREMAAPELHHEERQPRPLLPVEREQRRELREVQRDMQHEAPRLERPVPRETDASQFMRQREIPRAAPEVRMPAPSPAREMPQPRVEPFRQPVQEFRSPAAPMPMPQQRAEPPRPPVQEFRAPPPAPPAMPSQRSEPPRQQAPQGVGQPEQHRRHGNDDERGGR